jgi:hypothetical protein
VIDQAKYIKILCGLQKMFIFDAIITNRLTNLAMDIDRTLQIYQGYTLTKISALNKQQLIAQYAQCQKISDLEKSLKRELSAVNSTNRKILENQLKEEKRREEIKYYRETAYKAKEAIDLIHGISDNNFKCFLLNVFAQPFGNILTEIKGQLEEFADKEFCDKWLSLLNRDNVASKTNDTYINSPWYQILETELDYRNKIDNLKVRQQEIEDKKSAIKQPKLLKPEPKDKAVGQTGCSITCIVIFAFCVLVVCANLSGGASFMDLIAFIALAIIVAISYTLIRLKKYKEKQQWIDNYDSYVATITSQNTAAQSEYNNKMDEVIIDEGKLSEEKSEMSNHPYQVAISKANNLIPNWQTIVDQISEMLPKAENESEEIKTDPLLKEAALFVTESSTASTSSLQRKYSIGYNRAGAIMSKLEELKIVGPENGSNPRKVLVDYRTAKNIIESIS